MPPSKAKVACKSCNQRRVRCDRTDETPCSRCRATGQKCEPIVSKRGKHKRGPVRRSGFRHSFGPAPNTPETSTEVTSLRTPATLRDEGSAGGSPAPLCPSSEPQSHTTEAQRSRTTYYGDYFNLEYTRNQLDDQHEDYNPRMSSTRLPHVDRLGSPTRRLVDNYAHRERARLDEIGAFDVLDGKASDKLVRTFFELVYPVAPIIDRMDFYVKFQNGQISPLLLQAIYLVAFLHCEPSAITDAGFDNRYMATFTTYQRAKAIYDAGYESDAIAVIQALYCLSFWWEAPTQQKDMWYWSGVSVDLAQSLGMHQEYDSPTPLEVLARTKRNPGKPTPCWPGRRGGCGGACGGPYTHDVSTAVQLERIPHVNDAYCTARPITEQDFENDELPDGFSSSEYAAKEHRLHTIYLADLCIRVSRCHRLFHTDQPDSSVAFTDIETLVSWRASLPDELKCRNSAFTLQNGFLATVLNLTYWSFEILLRRNHFQNPRVMAAATPVFAAAAEIVRILEDIMSSELLTACPLRVLPPIFCALSVLIANMCRPESEVYEISRHRARLCMLVLSRLVDYWHPGLLYYRLFARILAARGCEVPPDPPAPYSALGQHERGNEAPTAEIESNHMPASSEITMGDVVPGEAELIGMNSLFPFSAFLNDEFLDTDLCLPHSDNECAPSL
ncbi:Zn(II)2Cys6 transcription factor [Aspergillus mulundensis]|uniref:Zn(2)-C6 fungal-type domain-containing protein n=1 Tax=Aspergillus mulundensis TaxID=1810919 RepID=A0A3D8QIT4_9EURO|nr:hypothetical protein DSM5745_10361 [Aspergillus mulundensis]RDW61689.1 hypothetical protein DSM5745_10361 [Aspergillus mulundensis]